MATTSLLVSHIRSTPSFRILEEVEGSYGHMGATLTDAVLQAGVRYDTVVRPRVQSLLAEHPDAGTTSAFESRLRELGPERLLRWRESRKVTTLRDLLSVLLAEGIETEDDLRSWLAKSANLDRLRRIKGIKEKTANYLMILVGEDTVAVDRHLLRFVAEAGVPAASYKEAHAVISNAAQELGVSAAVLDHSIWRYMSERVAAASS